MLNKNFSGRLVKASAKMHKESNEVVTMMTIQHIDTTGGVQRFLESLEKGGFVHNLSGLFPNSIPWKSVDVPCSVPVSVDFDEMSFDASVTGVKVSKKVSKKEDDSDKYVYNISMMTPSTDAINQLVCLYLNRKEEDPESGKKSLVNYSVFLKG